MTVIGTVTEIGAVYLTLKFSHFRFDRRIKERFIISKNLFDTNLFLL